MAIIKCPECGHQVSDHAKVCPSCGIEIMGNITRCPSCGEQTLLCYDNCPNCHEPLSSAVVSTPRMSRLAGDDDEPVERRNEERKERRSARRDDDRETKKGRHVGFVVFGSALVFSLALVFLGIYMMQKMDTQNEIDAFERAVSSNEPLILNDYLLRYKDAPLDRRDSVETMLKRLKKVEKEWDSVYSSKNRNKIAAFIEKYPTNMHVKEARLTLDSLDWAKAAEQNTVASYEAYLKNYANQGDHSDEATMKMEEIKTRQAAEEQARKDSIAAVEDSIYKANKGRKQTRAEKDSIKAAEYAEDPHRPEYYLKDIPLTEEQMEASNAALVEGLYGSAVIYKDRMDNFPLAERTFQRILLNFPEFDKMDEVYYNMFQLYSRIGRKDDAEDYRQKLIQEFPDNEHGKKIADPDFEFKGRYGKHIEDSVYTATYDAFQRSDYQTVLANSRQMADDYPEGDNRPRFLFLEAMSRLEQGDREHFMQDLKELVEKYPQSSVSELAGLYVKGLKEGRLLQGGKFEMGSIWERRHGLLLEGDSLMNDSTFSTEKNTDFVFVIAYERDGNYDPVAIYNTGEVFEGPLQ